MMSMKWINDFDLILMQGQSLEHKAQQGDALGLKIYMDTELLPHLHLKVGKGISVSMEDTEGDNTQEVKWVKGPNVGDVLGR